MTPAFRWMPVVTFLQLLADLTGSFTTPLGTGHNYAAAHYIDSWYALTEPEGWDEDSLERLRAWFADRGL